MSEIRYEHISFKEALIFKDEARKEHSYISEGKTPIFWLGAKMGSSLIGVVGFLKVSKTKARVRGLYVCPALRHRGVGAELMRFLISECIEEGVFMIDAHTKIPGFFKRFGFKEAGGCKAYDFVRLDYLHTG